MPYAGSHPVDSAINVSKIRPGWYPVACTLFDCSERSSSVTGTHYTHAGTTFKLANRTQSGGCGSSRGIQVIDPKVSHKHDILRRGDPGHMTSSAKAKNSLLINEEEVTNETCLADGDKAMLGDTVLRFSVDTESD